LIEDALRLTLNHPNEGEGEQRRPSLPLSKRRGGARPGVDVADGARLRDLMDFPYLRWRTRAGDLTYRSAAGQTK
jgi:hypothetical protein